MHSVPLDTPHMYMLCVYRNSEYIAYHWVIPQRICNVVDDAAYKTNVEYKNKLPPFVWDDTTCEDFLKAALVQRQPHTCAWSRVEMSHFHCRQIKIVNLKMAKKVILGRGQLSLKGKAICTIVFRTQVPYWYCSDSYFTPAVHTGGVDKRNYILIPSIRISAASTLIGRNKNYFLVLFDWLT